MGTSNLNIIMNNNEIIFCELFATINMAVLIRYNEENSLFFLNCESAKKLEVKSVRDESGLM